MDMFGWSVKIRSIQEELFFCIWVGSFISCWNPSEEVYANNLVPPVVLVSLDHQEDDLALISPVITDKYSLRFFISIISFSKLDKNKSNSSLFCYGIGKLLMQSLFCCCDSFLKEALH